MHARPQSEVLSQAAPQRFQTPECRLAVARNAGFPLPVGQSLSRLLAEVPIDSDPVSGAPEKLLQLGDFLTLKSPLIGGLQAPLVLFQSRDFLTVHLRRAGIARIGAPSGASNRAGHAFYRSAGGVIPLLESFAKLIDDQPLPSLSTKIVGAAEYPECLNSSSRYSLRWQPSGSLGSASKRISSGAAHLHSLPPLAHKLSSATALEAVSETPAGTAKAIAAASPIRAKTSRAPAREALGCPGIQTAKTCISRPHSRFAIEVLAPAPP